MKVGFLFGAGAERSYNMPSGGTFALEIFRQDATSAKEKFKEMRDNIDRRSRYANQWLPDGYSDKNISSFGKSVFESLIKDTIEHNRLHIVDKLNNFDSFAASIATRIEKQDSVCVDDAVYNITSKHIQDISMGQDIVFHQVFSTGNSLFKSNYFSALLEIYSRKEKLQENTRKELRNIITAILQLQIGALGANLSRDLSDNLFSKKPDDIDIFDDLGELLQLNYKSTGVSGLEYLLDCEKASPTSDENIILYFAQEIIENIFASVLDYKTLIDSYWHYLYCPSVEWAKFCKISIFLLTVKDYIEKQCEDADTSLGGYYHDLRDCGDSIETSCVATTNYTNLISNVIGDDIIYLNGSTQLMYDPYINKIGDEESFQDKEAHFLVPLLFTQSGTKPMTSIDMSIKYVETYQQFQRSDVICSVGFGFNPDDEHINGIIRTLVDEGKKLVVVTVDSRPPQDVKREIVNRLKITSEKNVEIMIVDQNRTINGVSWLEELEKYRQPQAGA